MADDPNAGVINAVSNFPALSRELILSLNEKEGKKNISTGFHAIEFLLWGQDLNPNGPGNRPWRDYTAGANHGDRRRQYLQIVTELLVEHLETVTAAWANASSPNEGRADLQVGRHPCERGRGDPAARGRGPNSP